MMAGDVARVAAASNDPPVKLLPLHSEGLTALPQPLQLPLLIAVVLVDGFEAT